MPRSKLSALFLEVAAARRHADEDLRGLVQGVTRGLDEAAKVESLVADRKIPRQRTRLDKVEASGQILSMRTDTKYADKF